MSLGKTVSSSAETAREQTENLFLVSKITRGDPTEGEC